MTPLPTLHPITPALVNRFVLPNPLPTNKEFALAPGSVPHTFPVVRSASATPTQNHIESSGDLTHPEGSPIFYWGVIISNQNITEQHTSLARYILDNCDETAATTPVTVYIEILGPDTKANYYVVAHSSKTITWVLGEAHESFRGASRAKHEHEYWVHMENFPGPHFSTPGDLRLLKHVLASNAIDALTSEGSTCPMSVAQINTHLTMLDSFSDEGDIYQTYAIARIWNLILQSRVINKYGTSAARLDRFISISDNPPTFRGTYASLAKLMFNRPQAHLERCSRAWADRIAYTEEWRKFRVTNEQEFKQVLNLSSVLIVASLINGKHSSFAFGIPVQMALLVALASAASAYYLLTESQNFGDHAADASVYFQEREEILYGVQRIAIINAVPQSLLVWAFILFVFSVVCM